MPRQVRRGRWFVDAAARAGARFLREYKPRSADARTRGEHLLPIQARKGPPSATVALLARSRGAAGSVGPVLNSYWRGCSAAVRAESLWACPRRSLVAAAARSWNGLPTASSQTPPPTAIATVTPRNRDRTRPSIDIPPSSACDRTPDTRGSIERSGDRRPCPAFGAHKRQKLYCGPTARLRADSPRPAASATN